MQRKEIAADLKINRRLSGLSNHDVAHLLGVDGARVSRIETGASEPTGSEICALSMIYGKTTDVLFPCSSRSIGKSLKNQLADMPPEPRNWRGHDARLDTLNGLAHRLQVIASELYDN